MYKESSPLKNVEENVSMYLVLTLKSPKYCHIQT